MNQTDTTANILKAITDFLEHNRFYIVVIFVTVAVLLFWAAYRFVFKRAPRSWRLILCLTAGGCGLLWGLSLLEIFFIPSISTARYIPYAASIAFILVTYGLLTVVFSAALKDLPFNLLRSIRIKRYNFTNRKQIAANKSQYQRRLDLVTTMQEERRRKSAESITDQVAADSSVETPEQRSARMDALIDQGLKQTNQAQ